MKRTRPIRRWLGIAILAMVLVPILAIGLIMTIVFAPTGGPREPWPVVRTLLEDHVTEWEDPAWQDALTLQLARDDARVILTVDGNEVYRSEEPLTDDTYRVRRRIDVPYPGHVAVAEVSLPTDSGPPEGLNPPLLAAVLIGTLIAVTALVALRLRRQIILPLEHIERGAEALASSSAAVDLIPSTIREVESVNTALHRASAQLQTLEAERVALEDQRRLFISSIAHDLRSPLFALRGSLEALDSDLATSPDRREAYLGLARSRADRLERLVADLFAFSRVEYLQESIESAEIDVAQFLEELSAATTLARDEQAVAIEIDVQPASLTLWADPALLARALENVLENAVRHSPARSVINVRAVAAGDGATITITDEGAGFRPADIDRVFDPMYRGDEARNTPGAGLGLAIAASIVRRHGGTITATNARPHGACVVIWLPSRHE